MITGHWSTTGLSDLEVRHSGRAEKPKRPISTKEVTQEPVNAAEELLNKYMVKSMATGVLSPLSLLCPLSPMSPPLLSFYSSNRVVSKWKTHFQFLAIFSFMLLWSSSGPEGGREPTSDNVDIIIIIIVTFSPEEGEACSSPAYTQSGGASRGQATLLCVAAVCCHFLSSVTKSDFWFWFRKRRRWSWPSSTSRSY